MRVKKKYNNAPFKAVSIILAVVMIPFLADGISGSQVFARMTETAGMTSYSVKLSDEATHEESTDDTEDEIIDINEKPAEAVGYDPARLESLSVTRSSIWDIALAHAEDETPVPEEELSEPREQSEVEGALPYPSVQENNSGAIRRITYERYDGWQFIDLDNGGQVRNCTSISADKISEVSRMLPDIKLEATGEPQILIMHTHTTESFEPYARNFFDDSFCSRTTDTTRNVVAVGNIICKQLDEAGIAYIHDTTVHDYPNYNGSYQRSRITAQEILEKYPSIKIVLDIHRDALITSDGTRLAPIAEVDGKNAAQVMIISGVDDGTMNMPNYFENFKLASLLQSTMESMYPGLTRPILFDYRHYNQDLTTGSLLIEIGAHANSLDEVMYSAELVGKAIVKAVNNK